MRFLKPLRSPILMIVLVLDLTINACSTLQISDGTYYATTRQLSYHQADTLSLFRKDNSLTDADIHTLYQLNNSEWKWETKARTEKVGFIDYILTGSTDDPGGIDSLTGDTLQPWGMSFSNNGHGWYDIKGRKIAMDFGENTPLLSSMESLHNQYDGHPERNIVGFRIRRTATGFILFRLKK